jgi:hypothetical protein
MLRSDMCLIIYEEFLSFEKIKSSGPGGLPSSDGHEADLFVFLFNRVFII